MHVTEHTAIHTLNAKRWPLWALLLVEWSTCVLWTCERVNMSKVHLPSCRSCSLRCNIDGHFLFVNPPWNLSPVGTQNMHIIEDWAVPWALLWGVHCLWALLDYHPNDTAKNPTKAHLWLRTSIATIEMHLQEDPEQCLNTLWYIAVCKVEYDQYENAQQRLFWTTFGFGYTNINNIMLWNFAAGNVLELMLWRLGDVIRFFVICAEGVAQWVELSVLD